MVDSLLLLLRRLKDGNLRPSVWRHMALLIPSWHGQSMWNAANLFTGWVDVPLTNKGIEEAISGGKEIASLPIDEVHVSTLIRAQMTAMLALAQHDSGKTPIFQYSESGDSMSENESFEWSNGPSLMMRVTIQFQCMFLGN